MLVARIVLRGIKKGGSKAKQLKPRTVHVVVSQRLFASGDQRSFLNLPPAKLNEFENEGSYQKWSDQIALFFDDSIRTKDEKFEAGFPGGIRYRLPPWSLDVDDNEYLQYYAPLDLEAIAGESQITEAEVTWNAFPKRIRDRTDMTNAEKYEYAEVLGWQPPDFLCPDVPVNECDQEPEYPLARQMDEYCEWFTHRDPFTNKITKITMTSEGPEYWDFLFQNEQDLLLRLYRQYVSPNVEMEDLTDPATGLYNRWNVWNTTEGIMHLNNPINQLWDQVYIGAEASTRWVCQPGDPLITEPQPLIECAQFGEPKRGSDPTIGYNVNLFIRGNNLVSLKNPVGLYLKNLNTNGWTDPDGNRFSGDQLNQIVRYERGHAASDTEPSERWVRIEVEIPHEISGGEYVLGDCLIGGEQIEHGGFLVENAATVFLTALAFPDPGLLPEDIEDATVKCKSGWINEPGQTNQPPPIVTI